MMAEGDGEALYAHFALQQLGLLPSALMALSVGERGFVYASIERSLRSG